MKAKIFVAALLAATLCMTAESFGGWGWGHRGYGSGGCWGSWGGGWGSWGGGYGGSYGSWGSGGSYGGWGGYRSRWSGWGGGYGSYGSRGYYGSGGCWGGYTSYRRVAYAAPVVTYSAPVVYDACSTVVYNSRPVVTENCCDGVVVEEAQPSYPVEQSYETGSETYEVAPQTAPLETTPMEAQPDGEARHGSSAMIVVNVPEDAEVYVNGYRTTSRGATRQFLSTGLKPGQNYVYEVRAVTTEGDKQLGATKVVRLTAGRRQELSFGELAEEPSTTLTLQVPADAKVELAGFQTKMTGQRRTFATANLQPGQSWDNYQIRVTYSQNGAVVTKEHSLKIRGGKSHFLSFDADSQLAAK